MKNNFIELSRVPDDGRSVPLLMSKERANELLAKRGVATPRLGGDIKGTLFVQRAGKRVVGQGAISAAVVQRCGRCLIGFTEEFGTTFNVAFSTSVAEGDGAAGEIELEDSDLEVELVDEHGIDLEKLLIDEFLLEVEQYPVCSDQCRGLCPDCGKPLGEGVCPCADEKIDPRFAALAGLKVGKKGDGPKN